jgi:hypothetical protein
VRRLAPLAAVAGLAALAGPAAADIRFEGQSSQGRRVILVADDNGVPKRAKVGWQARCARSGARPTEGTGFSRPLDVNTRRRFRDVGSYRLRDQPNARVTVWMSGRKVGPRRWAGRFRARLVLRRGGRVVNRCAVGGIRWRAVRVRT